MDNLEKYIQNNLEEFNCGEMPQGHQERFLAHLAEIETATNCEPGQETGSSTHHKAKRLFTRRTIFTATSAAAAIIIALSVSLFTANGDDEYSIEIQELAQQMYLEETDILMQFGEEDLYLINSVKSITEEAIPLSDQLPDELSPQRRAEILREYYKTKTAALKSIKSLYAQSEEITE